MHICRRITASVLAICIVFCGILQTMPVCAQAAYTKTAADEAMRSFQRCCYNEDTGLYWNNTDHGGIAAIWTHAIYWNMVLDAYERTGDSRYADLSNAIFQGGYDQYAGYDWNNHDVWFVFDDLMWWIISMARAYQLTGNTSCLSNVTAGFNNVYARAYDTVNGGMYWGFGTDGMGKGHKNSCINYPTIIAAMELYQITGESRYLSIAEDLYAWCRVNLFDAQTGSVPDLLADTGETDWTNYTYNEGTMIGAAAMLYSETGNSAYLADANLAAQYTQQTMCDANGILPAEGDWNEQGCMKAIFAHYMGVLVNTCNQQQWSAWMHNNANLAWANRDTTRNLTYRNYTVQCSQGMIQSYEACSGVALLQVFSPDEAENKATVSTPQAVLYQDMEYSGTSASIRPGRYTAEAIVRNGFAIGELTSLKVPAGCKLQIFSGDNFTGSMWEYTADCPNVGAEANDQMRSCIFYASEGATFYPDDMFGGTAVTLTKGTYTTAELQQYGILDNSISSLALPEGWCAIMYDQDNCMGDSWQFNRGTHNVGSSCNDHMSSVTIF